MLIGSLRSFGVILILTIWIVVSLILGSLLIAALFIPLELFTGYSELGSNVQNMIVGTATYAAILAIFVGVPWLIRRDGRWRELLGVQRLVNWLDIGISLAGLVFYFVFSIALMYVVLLVFPGLDLEQAQDVGFTAPTGGELWLAFILLVIIAPVVEEVIFRGYLYGALRRNGVSFITTTIVVSVLFGAAHGQWNVGINVAVLSVMMCIGREITGTIWPGVLMHMMKNGLAFTLLFGATPLPGLQ